MIICDRFVLTVSTALSRIVCLCVTRAGHVVGSLFTLLLDFILFSKLGFLILNFSKVTPY